MPEAGSGYRKGEGFIRLPAMDGQSLGMLMLPKTICYILLICAFLKATGKKQG